MRNRTAFFIVSIIILFSSNVLSANITSAASGNWNAATTWVGGVVPGAADSVFIGNGHTVTVTANTTCLSLSYITGQTTATGVVTVNSGVILTVTGSINAPASDNAVKITASLTLSGQGTTNCGSLNVGNKTVPGASGTSTIDLVLSISTMNISGNVTLYSTYSTNGNKLNLPLLDIRGNLLKIDGQILTDNQNAGSVSKMTCSLATSPVKVILTHENPIVASGTGTTIIDFNYETGTFEYNRNGAQTIYPTAYKNLTIVGTGEKTTNSVTVDGLLVVEGGGTLTTTPTYATPPTLTYSGSTPETTGNEIPGNGQIKRIIVNNSGGLKLKKSIQANNVIVGNLVSNSYLIDNGNLITADTLTLVSGRLDLQTPGNAFPVATIKSISPGFTIGYTGSENQTVSNSVSYDNLVLGGSGTKTTTGVTVNNSLVMDGTAEVTAKPNYTNPLTLEYRGNGNKTTGPELPSGLAKLKISKTDGDVILNSDITVTDSVIFTGGKLRTGSNKVTLNGSALVSGETNEKYLVGRLARTEAIGTGSSSASLNSMGISFSSGSDDMGNLSVERITETESPVGNRIKRLWTISAQNSPSLQGRDVTFSWLSDEVNTVDLSYAVVYKSTNGGAEWFPVTEPVEVTGNSITVPAVKSFSVWTIGDGNNPLPVELSSFTAKVSGNNVYLNWQTATEVNNYGFEIERRVLSGQQTVSWKKIGFIEGAGNSN